MIDPDRCYVSAILDKDNCIPRDCDGHPRMIKDLRVLLPRISLTQTVFVDSDVFAMREQLENAVYVPAYNPAQGEDTELSRVAEFLLTVDGGVTDVRPLMSRFAGVLRLFRAYCKAKEEEEEEEDSERAGGGLYENAETVEEVGDELRR